MDAERVQQLQDEVEDLRRRLENAKYLCDSYKHRAASAEASSARVTEELAYTKTQLLAVNARLQTLEKHRKLKMLRDEEIELLNNIAATTAQLQGLLVDEHMLSEHSRPLSVTKSRKHSRRAHSLTQNLENMNQQLFRCRTNIRELELSFTLIRNLCEASVSGDVAGIQTTLAKGVGVNESDEMGACALHYACSGGSEDACALLLDAGADVNGTHLDYAPLVVACKTGSTAVVRCLLSRGAAMDACDSTGRTPLCAASKNGHDQVAEMLLDAGACVNARDEDGSTALHVVASTAHVHMVHLLASHGAALRAVNANKQTPLEIALRTMNRAMANAIRQCEADERITT